MLIIEVLQAVLVLALLQAAGRRPPSSLLLWTAVGFGASQLLTSWGDGLAGTFFRLFVAVYAADAVGRWKSERQFPAWAAGAAALVCGVLAGWVA